MAAKLLHSLANDNPDLQKQIGCMTGIFQLFDRQQILNSRHIKHKKPPPGNPRLNNCKPENEYNAIQRKSTTDRAMNESFNEKQNINKESSRASFSSCSSSSSTGEYNKTAHLQLQTSSFDQMILSRSSSRESVTNQPIASPHIGKQRLDLRDVVKDSMYREARMLSIKTTKEEVVSHSTKYNDFSSPSQLSQSADGTSKVDTNWKQKVHVDLKESLLVLSKLREAPWYYNEVGEHERPSHDVRGGYLQSLSRDTSRFSCDGREINRLSFESRDTIRSAPKLKEISRLSLDSRESSIQGSKFVSSQTRLSKNLRSSNSLREKSDDPPQSIGTRKQPPSIVAKLMGLDALPGSPLADNIQSKGKAFVSSLDGTSSIRPIITFDSPRTTLKGPTSPRWKNPDLIMKHAPNSRFPVEIAPWSQLDGNRVSHKPTLKHAKGLDGSPNSFHSVYSEFEKRLEDLKFKQSGKDHRAGKQTFEAMQLKELLDTGKGDKPFKDVTQRVNELERSHYPNSRLISQQSQQKSKKVSTTSRPDSSRLGESPIVIMKPAKVVEKSGIPASSVISIDSLPGLPKLQKLPHNKMVSNGTQVVKETTPENGHGNSGVSSTKRKDSAKNVKSKTAASKPQQQQKESTISATKSSGSVSPRLQQKKVEQDKRSRPPTPPSDSNKTKRKSNRQAADLGSPIGKLGLKSSHVAQSDDQMSEMSNESRTLSYQGDDMSQLSDSNLSLDSKTDIEVTSSELSAEINGSQSLKMKAANYLSSCSTENAELATPTPEHHSPISILDAFTIYRDEDLSPVKQIVDVPKGKSPLNSRYGDEHQCCSTNVILSNSTASAPTAATTINREKLQNIDNLVQKLRRLNSHYDEAKTDYIASLCENIDPDNRYISEIFLASGLLLRDLGSGMTTFQFHPSGHPINPELFFVLEQTKTSSLQRKEDCSSLKVGNSKLNQEKSHRKFIFDVVNEILAQKLAFVGEPWTTSKKLATKTISAQKLLKELCSEIYKFQTKEANNSQAEDHQEDSLKLILSEDVMQRCESWTDSHGDTSAVILDVERLIFKDLVDEVVKVEGAHFRATSGSCRQLFA